MFRKFNYMNDYNKENYDRFTLLLPKGKKERVKAAAAAAGMSTSEYINALIDADAAGSSIAKLQQFTPEQAHIMEKWQVPRKYFDMIESFCVSTDEGRQAAAAAGKRIACCEYTIQLKAGYINDETGGRIIRTNKTKEIRRIIVKSHAE